MSAPIYDNPQAEAAFRHWINLHSTSLREHWSVAYTTDSFERFCQARYTGNRTFPICLNVPETKKSL